MLRLAATAVKPRIEQCAELRVVRGWMCGFAKNRVGRLHPCDSSAFWRIVRRRVRMALFQHQLLFPRS